MPGRDASFSSANRDFCDFAALRSARGRWSMFGVQAPQDIFVPRGGEVGASGDHGARIGYYVHSFHACARPGETVRLPAQTMVLGRPHREVLRDHADRCGFATRPMEAKADARVVGTLKRGILLKVNAGDFKQAARVALLCRLQAAVGPRCAGRRLDDFAYLAARVIRSRWGDLEVIANLAEQPWQIDPDTIIAPGGFAARAPDLEAGIFTRLRGEDWSGAVRWVIREKGGEGWAGWSAGELGAEP